MIGSKLLELDLLRFASHHLGVLNDRGFDVEMPKSFNEVKKCLESGGPIKSTKEILISKEEFEGGHAFWLLLKFEDRYAGSVAARFTDIKGENLESFIRRTSKTHYERKGDPIATIAQPIRDCQKSKLIYIGELEIHPTRRGRVQVVNSFMRMMITLAAMRWPSFDMAYAFVKKEHNKLSDGYGFTIKVPSAITWKEPVPKGRRNDHVLVATTRSHLVHQAKHLLS